MNRYAFLEKLEIALADFADGGLSIHTLFPGSISIKSGIGEYTYCVDGYAVRLTYRLSKHERGIRIAYIMTAPDFGRVTTFRTYNRFEE